MDYESGSFSTKGLLELAACSMCAPDIVGGEASSMIGLLMMMSGMSCSAFYSSTPLLEGEDGALSLGSERASWSLKRL